MLRLNDLGFFFSSQNDEDKEGKENKPEESNKEDQTDSGVRFI